MTDPTVVTTVVMAATQTVKTELLLNVAGYYMHQDAAPMLFVMPTLQLAEGLSKDRLATMIRDTPVLRELVDDSDCTLLHKQFPGGHLTLAGANSPASLASRPIRILLADEVDLYAETAGEQGDPWLLAEKRTATFWNRKLILVSTPGVKETSRIEPAYLASDRRQYFVPCPHCGEAQVLKWQNVQWSQHGVPPEEAALFCAHCSKKWSESDRLRAVSDGIWRASAPFRGVAGFHLNQLYSPWVTPAQIAVEFVQAKKYRQQQKTWTNTRLAETWEETRNLQEPEVLRARAEDYPLGIVPAGALLVVAAVDVQGDRLEAYTWGYGEGEEAWVIDFREFYGDPARSIVWDQLLEYLGTPLQHELGALVVPRTVAIDSGGLHTQIVYSFCRNYAMRRTPFGLQQIIAIKGASEKDKPVIGKPTPQDINLRGDKIRNGVQLWPVGSHGIKQTLYHRLAIDTPGHSYIHTTKDLPEEFFDQIVSERLRTRHTRGFPILEWELPSGRRNEALDCAVYAYAAAYQLGLPRMKPIDWQRQRAAMSRPAATAAPSVTAPPLVPGVPPQGAQSTQGVPPKRNWATDWRK